jgi:hypothetical protein
LLKPTASTGHGVFLVRSQRKFATTCLLASLRPSVCQQVMTRNPLNQLSWNQCFIETFQFWFKTDKNQGISHAFLKDNLLDVDWGEKNFENQL